MLAGAGGSSSHPTIICLRLRHGLLFSALLGAPNQLIEGRLSQSPRVVAGAEERHLSVVADWILVGIAHAKVPELGDKGLARAVSMREPVLAQHLPVLPDEVFTGRSAVRLGEMRRLAAGRHPAVFSNRPHERIRQAFPFELLTRQQIPHQPVTPRTRR